MSIHYELTRLAFRANGVPAALPRLERALATPAAGTRLLGAFVAEIGPLNEVTLLHALETPSAPLEARDARLRAGDLYGVADDLVEACATTLASFPFAPAARPGRVGPVFELREYTVKPGGLPALLSAWEARLPARLELSTLVMAAYAIDGVQPRIAHLWAYRDLVERGRVRADAVARGIWPPQGGADYLATMRTSIHLPTPFSPLQ